MLIPLIVILTVLSIETSRMMQELPSSNESNFMLPQAGKDSLTRKNDSLEATKTAAATGEGNHSLIDLYEDQN